MTAAELEEMVWDVLGFTDYTIPQLTALTFPQLVLVQRGRGHMLWPKLEVQLAARRLEGLTDDPGTTGEPSQVQKVLDAHERFKRGEIEPVTEKDRRWQRAYRIMYQKYLGDPDRAQKGTAQPEA